MYMSGFEKQVENTRPVVKQHDKWGEQVVNRFSRCDKERELTGLGGLPPWKRKDTSTRYFKDWKCRISGKEGKMWKKRIPELPASFLLIVPKTLLHLIPTSTHWVHIYWPPPPFQLIFKNLCSVLPQVDGDWSHEATSPAFFFSFPVWLEGQLDQRTLKIKYFEKALSQAP